MFAEFAFPIFEESIKLYHVIDDAYQPTQNPYEKGSIEHLLFAKNWVDTVQWHYEDIIRDPNIDPVAALVLKRKIDASNQVRTDMVEYIDSYFLANKGRCENRTIWINRDLAKHGDLQFILNNEHYRPSFEYQETFNFLSSDEISIFTDGTFTPTKIYVSYMRYPKYIDKEGYIKFDGEPSVDQDCELETYLEDELLDLTVQNLAMYTENSAAVQSAQFRIQTNE